MIHAVYGWLSLDRRGRWLIRRERIGNSLITAYIGRNYGPDERGCWFFRNGPQRVFVGLDYTPLVYRVVSVEGAPLELECHTGRRVSIVEGAWMDETGALLLLTEQGIGLVHDGDLARLVPCLIAANGNRPDPAALEERMETVQRGRSAPLWLRHRGASVKIEPIASGQVPQRFGFVAQPVLPADEKVRG